MKMAFFYIFFLYLSVCLFVFASFDFVCWFVRCLFFNLKKHFIFIFSHVCLLLLSLVFIYIEIPLSENNFNILVSDKPVITIRHITYNVTAGDNITLECKVFAYPVVLSSSWSRNVTGTFQNIVPDERKLNFSSISEPSLTIKFVELTDSGVYVCQSTNDAGTTYGTPIYLNVIGGMLF